MKKHLPKILVLFCGGTIVMQADQHGTLQTQTKKQATRCLLNMEPKLSTMAQVDVHYIANIDSTNIDPTQWDVIAKTITTSYAEYDGFVITHGTNTMAYTASALSFALPNIGKPVVLTGAQIPGYKLETDARRNFVNAVRVATADIAGVLVVFDEEVMLGVRSSKVSESKLDAFETINAEDIGEIRTQLRLNPHRKRRNNKTTVQCTPGFSSHVAVLTMTPSLTPQLVEFLVKSGTRGIVVRGYGPGDVPYTFLPVLHRAQELGVPVIVMSQCLEGATAMHMNDVGAQALTLGVIQAYDMSLECIIAKLMWLVHHEHNTKKIKKMMHKNYCGEINTNNLK